MNNSESGRWAVWLSFPPGGLLAVSSLAGLLVPSIYFEQGPHRPAIFLPLGWNEQTI